LNPSQGDSVKTTGDGSEGLLIAVPVIALLLYGVISAGGPSSLVSVLDSVLRAVGNTVVTWLQTLR